MSRRRKIRPAPPQLPSATSRIITQTRKAAASSLPPARFAVGAAVNATSRQLGAVLGVAILVALLGTPGPGEALDAFDRAWTFIAAGGVLAAFAALGLGAGPVAARTPAPAPSRA